MSRDAPSGLSDGSAISDATRSDRLLKEYELNVALWQHDDTLRQKRIGNFLTVNSILLVGVGALFTVEPALDRSKEALLVLSGFGVVVSIAWYLVQWRNSEYIRFRRFVLRSIERQLPPMQTFEATYRAFYRGVDVSLNELNEPFTITGAGRVSSTTVENRLPLLTGAIWLVVFVTLGVRLLIGL